MEHRMQKDHTKPKLKKSEKKFFFWISNFFDQKFFFQFFDGNTDSGGDATHKAVGGLVEQLTSSIQVRSGHVR